MQSLDFFNNSCGIGVSPVFEILCWRSLIEVEHIISAELPYIAPGAEMRTVTFLLNPLMGKHQGRIAD
ncbi:hypothetical protein [Microseira sp. BLCC-F43]|uniref:hypothetical protein n=1 Tax=Microseira sp. BLCC-F43 TaxID=3153602 RepID=UPI0035B83E23